MHCSAISALIKAEATALLPEEVASVSARLRCSTIVAAALLLSMSLCGQRHPKILKLRLTYGDPFQHIPITFPGAPPAYPFPPETRGM